MEHVRGEAGLLLVALVTGCGEVPLLEELAPEQSCRRTVAVGPVGVPLTEDTVVATVGEDGVTDEDDDEPGSAPPEAEWLTPRNDLDRQQNNAWCAAVGPAIVGGWGEPAAEPLDSLTVVSWNLHIGGGDLERLIADLRGGRLTGGQPVEEFVILLQEAYRENDDVPTWRSGFPFGSGAPLSPPSGVRRDVIEAAEELGLYLFYAPSMRSGEGTTSRADRGNAILSTLPLEEHSALELPVARQRRVAVSARVSGVTGAGEEWSLDLASVHLENDARGWTNDARARLVQADALLEGLSDDEPAIAAGDFNSWTRGQDEAVVVTMLEAYPDTPPFPPGPTYIRGYGVVRRYLDYMFFRLPDGARARYERADDLYNSDHFPLVGRVVFPTD